LKIDKALFDYQVHQFPNGLRMVHKQVPGTRVSHCGFILDVGSRDELTHQQGIAHFWEHMAFKVNINCFKIDPSIKSSLVFLRRTAWARNKVEAMYMEMMRKK
jgi:hypothetical protein